MEKSTFDLLLLFGPPLLNKVSYVPNYLLQEEYVPLSLYQLFGDNPSFGLRDASLRIISELKRGKQVIIEDELRLASARKSILSTVKKKVPRCKALLVTIVPDHGLLQVLWCHQNAHGRGTLPHCSCQNETVCATRWFDSTLLSVDYLSGYVDAPRENEGFEIKEVQAPFQLESSFKCEVPSLFIQWEVVVADMEESGQPLAAICRRWIAMNVHGRIIVISDGKKDLKVVSKGSSNVHQYMKQLSMKIDQPVFIVNASSGPHTNSFCIPPQPGLLAFIQTRHFIDLQQSVYIIDSTDHMKMAQAAGVRFVKTLTSQCVIPPVPVMLRARSEVKCQTVASATASLPLLDVCVEHGCGFTSRTHSSGLEEFVFIPDVTKVLNLQESFASLVTPTNEPGSKMKMTPRRDTTTTVVSAGSSTPCTSTSSTNRSKKKSAIRDRPGEQRMGMRDGGVGVGVGVEGGGGGGSNPRLPVWMTRRLSRKSTESSASGVESDELDSSSSSFKFSKTIYLMSEKELKEMALQIMTQAGKPVQEETAHQRTVDDKDHPG